MEIVSDALPIQFTKLADTTYNEAQFGFADKIPFYQQWQCDDPIKLQVVKDDSLLSKFKLKMTHCDGSPFTEVIAQLPALNTWANLGAAGANWTAGPPTNVHVGPGAFAFSKAWGTAFNFVAGTDYHFNWDVSVAPDTNVESIEIVSLDAGNNIVEVLYTVADIDSNPDLVLTPALNAVKIGVKVEVADGLNIEVFTLNTLELNNQIIVTNTRLDYVPSLAPGIIPLNFLNPTFPAVLAPWVNYNAGAGIVSFAWDFVNDILADGTAGAKRQTAILYQPRPDGEPFWIPGKYKMHMTGGNASTGPDAGTMYCQWLGSNDGIAWTALNATGALPTGGGFNFDIDVVIPFGQRYKYLGFLFNIGPPGNVVIVHVSSVNQVNTFSAEYDLNFQIGDFSVAVCDLPQGVKFFIQKDDVDIYKSDTQLFLSSIEDTPSWGSKLIGYKSIKNFAGIKYPGDDTYFYFRTPCQFFRQRPKGSQDSIPSGGNSLLNTSIVKGKQQLMKVIYSPDYIHNKLELIFQHAASGSVLIDGVFWSMEEGYEVSPPDEKSPFQLGKIWLSDSNYLIRNMI